MRRVLGHLTAVILATVLAGAVIGGAGDLIVFGGGLSRPVTAGPSAAPTPTTEEAAGGVAASVVAAAQPTPSAIPSPTLAPLIVAPYRSGGRSYVGITTPNDATSFGAPFAGTVEVRTYQLIDGEVRVGSNVPTLPFFPYITVVASDRRITFRPAALGATELIAKDGALVAAGDPLFRLTARARSSWAAFYDGKIDFQVVVSLQSVPGNRDLDAAPLFAAN